MAGDNMRGRLVVLAGPSAVGKSTVVRRLRHDIADLFFSVSVTTRGPRPGEVNGVDYWFISAEDFQHRIDRGEMLEWADIHGGLQRSGTPAQPVLEALEAGRPVLVEVDLAGARAVKSSLPDAHTVFLAPPSWEVLVDRLVNRATEPEDVIARRLETARNELDAAAEFDYRVINDDIDAAVGEISAILQSESSMS